MDKNKINQGEIPVATKNSLLGLSRNNLKQEKDFKTPAIAAVEFTGGAVGVTRVIEL